MASEATKTMQRYGDVLRPLLQGEGLDIGAGGWPVLPDVDIFDLEQGDANEITRYVDRTYDWVFSSHCLEHMEEPASALAQWYQLVRPGGRLIVTVPDEDLYEQGFQAGTRNSDHKWTFTIAKGRSWSTRSRNVADLAAALPGGVVERLELQDDGLDRRLVAHGPVRLARLRALLALPARAVLALLRAPVERRVEVARWGGAVIDQTLLPDARLAQILLVVRKEAPA